jgi:hypothetical protein
LTLNLNWLKTSAGFEPIFHELSWVELSKVRVESSPSLLKFPSFISSFLEPSSSFISSFSVIITALNSYFKMHFFRFFFLSFKFYFEYFLVFVLFNQPAPKISNEQAEMAVQRTRQNKNKKRSTIIQYLRHFFGNE